jgi:hypothetical protein
VEFDLVFLSHIRAVPQQRDRVLKQGSEVQRLPGARRRLCEGEKILDEVVQPVAFPDQDVEKAGVLAGESQAGTQQFHRAAHGGERISNFVRDACRHTPHGHHPVPDTNLILQPLDVGQVLEDGVSSVSDPFEQRRTL